MAQFERLRILVGGPLPVDTSNREFSALSAPEDLAILTAVYDQCIDRLQLADRDDVLTELLAKRIIEAANHGERRSARYAQYALASLGR